MIANNLSVQTNSNKIKSIQSDQQHSLLSVDAEENYHPKIFFLRCSNPGLGSILWIIPRVAQ